MNKEIILPKSNISQTCPKEKIAISVPYDDCGTQNNGMTMTKARYELFFFFMIVLNLIFRCEFFIYNKLYIILRLDLNLKLKITFKLWLISM